MEIKDNQFSRQFETVADGKMFSVEYAVQERKLFLTKVNIPEGAEEEPTLTDLFKEIMALAEENRQRVVPTHPKAAAFFRKNTGYKDMLPPGIRI
jgi:hypothetical protein